MPESTVANPIVEGKAPSEADMFGLRAEIERLEEQLARDRAEVERLDERARAIKARIGAAPPAMEPQSAEIRFRALLDEWRTDTMLCSFVSDMVLHPAYQRIIGMGPEVVPLLLQELEKEPDHLFWALSAITGEDPVQPDERGDIDRMARAWLQWGQAKGLR